MWIVKICKKNYHSTVLSFMCYGCFSVITVFLEQSQQKMVFAIFSLIMVKFVNFLISPCISNSLSHSCRMRKHTVDLRLIIVSFY